MGKRIESDGVARKRIYRTIDLCAGIGGIRRGFELTGRFENVLSAEIDEGACRTYELLFGENPRNNLTTREFKDKVKGTPYDILLAGFPCQAFSGVGLQKGFRDAAKGTIFFDIAEIADETRPKAIFLENVSNLVSHDHGKTIKCIIHILEEELNYHVIGVEHVGNALKLNNRAIVRNTKDFGLPQNRPRVYLVAFSREYFGRAVESLPNTLPEKGVKTIFESVDDVLDADVEPRYFLSSGYLETLERHAVTQSAKGYGFGYNIVNRAGDDKPIATTLLATGGSGRERNLVVDSVNGRIHAGKKIGLKKSPINRKCIRMMTPNEWGRLQGFIGYGFMEGKVDHFRFPEKTADAQKYKQIGNSVSIPVVEQLAGFLVGCIDAMCNAFDDKKSKMFELDADSIRAYGKIKEILGSSVRKKTYWHCLDLLRGFGCSDDIPLSAAADFFAMSPTAVNVLFARLCAAGCMQRMSRGMYSFSLLKRLMPKKEFSSEYISSKFEAMEET